MIKKHILQIKSYLSRFMESSSSNLVNNLAEEIRKIKCKYEHDDKKFTDSFTVYIKTEENYTDIPQDVEARFDTSNDELN